MDVLLVAKSRKEPGPPVTIRCPKCSAEDVQATAYRQVDDLCAFYFLKLMTLRNTFVECLSCRAKLRSSVDLDELPRYRGGELNQFLTHDISFVVKFLAIASVLMCIVPFVGPLLALITVIATLKSPGWARTLGRVSLVIGCIITGLAVVAILLGK